MGRFIGLYVETDPDSFLDMYARLFERAGITELCATEAGLRRGSVGSHMARFGGIEYVASTFKDGYFFSLTEYDVKSSDVRQIRRDIEKERELLEKITGAISFERLHDAHRSQPSSDSLQNPETPVELARAAERAT